MYRSIETSMWDDPWFAELAPNAKLLFIYLITNRRVTPCGAFEIQRRALSFETGLPGEAVKEAFAALSDKVTWWGEHQIVFVHNFYRWQRANTGPSFTTAARNALARMPRDVQETVGGAYPELLPPSEYPPPPSPNGKTSHPIATIYPPDTLPTPTPEGSDTHGTSVTVTVTEAETATGQQQGGNARVRATRPPTKTLLPNPFEISDAMWTWAEGNGYPTGFIEDATEYFVDWARSNGHKRADWTGTWRNMMRSKWSEQNGKVRTLRRA